MKIDCINKSAVPNALVNEFIRDVESRMNSIDFSPFGLREWAVHVVIDADSESVSLANPLDDSKKFIHFQGIPSEINYNSAFEAKIVNIRLRLQNMTIPFRGEIRNIIFIIDFSSASNNENVTAGSHRENAYQNVYPDPKESVSLANSVRGLFKKKNDKEDE